MKKKKPNPLRADPSRTATLRRVFQADIKRRFKRLTIKLIKLVAADDAFGLAVNARFRFDSKVKQMESFQLWLATQIEADIIGPGMKDRYWEKYIEEGYRKGAGRAFDDVKKAPLHSKNGTVSDFYRGTRSEFLKSSFGHPESIEKVKLLASRTYMDLKGATEAMSSAVSRTLMDGLVQGQNPHVMAKNMLDRVDKIGATRASTIARTEIIRAHAEGQLDAMERMGVEEVGVMVEWSTAGDDRVCPLCIDMDGVVIKIQEAHGLIPRHPNCRCCHLPANVGENTKGQVRGKGEVQAKIDSSIEREMSDKAKREGRTLEEQKQLSKWAGADVKPTKPLKHIAAGETPTPIKPEPVKLIKPIKTIEPIKPKPVELKVTKGYKAKGLKSETELWKNKAIPSGYENMMDDYELAGARKTLVREKYMGMPSNMYKERMLLSQEMDVLTERMNMIRVTVSEMDDVENAAINQLATYEERVKAAYNTSRAKFEVKRLEKKMAAQYDNLEEKRLKFVDAYEERQVEYKALEAKVKEERDKVADLMIERCRVSVEHGPDSLEYATIAEKASKQRDKYDKLSGELSKMWETNNREVTVKMIGPPKTSEVKFHEAIGSQRRNKNIKKNLADAKEFYETVLNESKHTEVSKIGVKVIRKNKRAHATGNTINLASNDTITTVVHEIGHTLEHSNSEHMRLSLAFRAKRVKDELPINMLREFGGKYKPYETASSDGFLETIKAVYGMHGESYQKNLAYYVGKWYDGATEITSMGAQMLFDDAVAFAKTDPEFFRYILGVLDGSLL